MKLTSSCAITAAGNPPPLKFATTYPEEGFPERGKKKKGVFEEDGCLDFAFLPLHYFWTIVQKEKKNRATTPTGDVRRCGCTHA